MRPLGRLLWTGVLAIMLSACVSQKMVAMSLDDAIVDITSKARIAQCDNNAPVADVTLELFVKTAGQVEAGAPLGPIPVTIGGKLSGEESSKVTVKLGALQCPTGTKQNLLQSLRERRPTLYWYDPDTGKLERMK